MIVLNARFLLHRARFSLCFFEIQVQSETANGMPAAVPFEEGRYFEPPGILRRNASKMQPAMKQFIQFRKQREL
jgi:hypothetical protein